MLKEAEKGEPSQMGELSSVPVDSAESSAELGWAGLDSVYMDTGWQIGKNPIMGTNWAGEHTLAVGTRT